LAADDQLALAYLAKMIEAAWITGSAEDYRAAYDAATELVAEDDYAAKYTIEAMGLRGEERIAAAGKALMHCPDDPMLIAWTAFWMGGDTDESVQMLERGMKRWPYMAAFHNLMGYRLMAKEDMEGALAHFKLQTRLLPDAANPWDSLGDYYVEVGNKEEARKAFEKALEVDPSFDASKRKLEELDAEDTAS
jgi:Flp pilus assembly protein TadD